MSDTDQLRAHAERIHASGVLGRSRLLRRLFDFLVDCSLNGRTVKEIEVAIDVFGKNSEFDVSQDAMVRVYVHKLRRKLDEFYAGPGRADPLRIVIPKGAYRVSLEPQEPDAAAMPAPSMVRKWLPRWLAGALAAALLLNAGLLAARYLHHADPAAGPLQSLRDSPVWAPLFTDQRPIFLVLGDYYIFGETGGDPGQVKRLIRESSINSPADLQHFRQMHPDEAEHYHNLNLAYLPTSVAFALRDIMPILATANGRVRVTLASQLNPTVLKSAHVIYLGYLSGMGMLHDLAFAGSRFTVGDSFGELIDRKTHNRYISQAAQPGRGDNPYRDYGYFSTLRGPTGNRIIIIAGTHDVAVMHVAEALTQSSTLNHLLAQVRGARSFEALYEVYGMDRMNLDGRLLLASKLNTNRMWTDEPRTATASAGIVRGAPLVPQTVH